jgi:hypothetical protein
MKLQELPPHMLKSVRLVRSWTELARLVPLVGPGPFALGISLHRYGLLFPGLARVLNGRNKKQYRAIKH